MKKIYLRKNRMAYPVSIQQLMQKYQGRDRQRDPDAKA